MCMITDALGNEIVIGGLYGYSRNDGGFSHTTVGRAEKVVDGNDPRGCAPAKVRLADLRVSHYLYGKPYTKGLPGSAKQAKTIMIAAYMVFPVQLK